MNCTSFAAPGATEPGNDSTKAATSAAQQWSGGSKLQRTPALRSELVFSHAMNPGGMKSNSLHCRMVCHTGKA
eukprot:15455781-Alexandrium_andersonii.AAC.1